MYNDIRFRRNNGKGCRVVWPSHCNEYTRLIYMCFYQEITELW